MPLKRREALWHLVFIVPFLISSKSAHQMDCGGRVPYL